jgi:VWFA-related protein
MEPGDLVAIIRTGSGMGALQQFTADKRLLYAAIDRVKFNSFGRVGISSFTPLGSGPDMGSDDANDSIARADEERTSIFAAGSLGAIRYVVDGLRELPGRKSVIMFSENMSLVSKEGIDQRVMDSLRHLTDAANRASVVLYTIDPRGLQVHSLTAADNTRGMTAQQIADVPSQRSEQEIRSQDGLFLLAHDTGGLFLHNTNDIDGALRKAIEDSEGYYLIGYHPDANTFDQKTGDPKFHNVAVRVKVPGLRVRTRAGFFGTSDRERQNVAQTRTAQIQHALTSPFGSAGIHVRLTPLFSAVPGTGSYLNTMLYIDAKDLHFSDEPEGWHKAAFDLVTMTFGDNGQPIDSLDRTYTIRVKDKTYEGAMKQGIIYNVAHPVKKPGAYQMRAVVRDTSSGETGSASQFIEVPDIKKGRLTLSSVVLKEWTPDAKAASVDHPEGQVQEANPEGSAAVRVFHAGSSLLYGYIVLNAQPESAKENQLEVQTRLFRDGKQIYTGKPYAMEVAAQPDPRQLVAGGTMKLGKVEPGDYVLQVLVTDKLAKEKYRTATSFMDFEVK